MAVAAALVCATVFKSGQPALLYLVPSLLGTTGALAWRRRELGWLWSMPEPSELKRL